MYAQGIEEFIERCDQVMPPDFHTRPIARQREMYHSLVSEFPYTRPEDVQVSDTALLHGGHAVTVRVYTPVRRRDRAALLYIRGGGFVVGSLDTHDTVVADLASKTGLTTFAVDFRLAPEHPFPAAAEDCYATLCAVAENAERFDVDAARIGIAGDSSGGNLAVVLCLLTRDRGGPVPCAQALISPVLDFTRWQHGGADSPLLTGGEMEFYTRCYSPDPDQVASPYVSPLLGAKFHDLPPAYIMSAEMDPLKLDAEQYAEHLRANQVPVEIVVEPGLVHSAVRARGLSPQVADAWDRYCEATARLVSGPPQPLRTRRARRAVIVDPYSSGAFYAPAFREAGIEPVAVLSGPGPLDVYASAYRPRDFGEIIRFEGDPAPIVARLRALDPVCILSGCESGVELTDLLAPQVDTELSNVPELAAARRHKGAMAQAAKAAGLATIRQICTDDPEEVAAWIESCDLAGHDLVVKPPKSASTDGVVRVVGGGDWQTPFTAALGATNRVGLINDEVIVQEYLCGTEFVVDTVSVGGRHSITDLCRYTKVDNGPHMAVYDRMEWLPYDEEVYGDLFTYAKAVLDAVGIRTGAAHIEIMLTDDGPRLIEVGARPHGGGQPLFCRVATGDSQVDRLVRYFAGQGAPEAAYTLQRHVMVVFLISRASGVVRNAEVYEQFSELASCEYVSVHVANGDRVAMTKDLFATLALGFVVLAHERADQVQADYERIRAIEETLVIEPDLVGVGQ